MAGPQRALPPAPLPDVAEVEDVAPDVSDVAPDVAPDVAQDAPLDLPTEPDQGGLDAPQGPGDFRADAFYEDFARPEPDVAPEDAPSDAQADAPDAVEEPVTRIEGTRACLDYQLETSETIFTLKEDQIAVLFQVNNICSEPYHVRLAHASDMFPVGIQKDGEPWVFLPDCPGTGEPFTYTLRPGDGWSRGWLWSPGDHLARLERCGVSFDPEASYAIVGYGTSDAPQTDPEAMSGTFPLTEPIPIFLYVAEDDGE